MDFPVLSYTKPSKRHIRGKTGAVYLRKHPKAGHSGYSPDMLQASTDLPEGHESCLHTVQDGITVYFDPGLAIEKYDQIDLWTVRKYWFITQLKARITLYRRLTFDQSDALLNGTSA